MSSIQVERRKDYSETIERLTRVEAQIESFDKALNLAREQLEKRLEGMNEFRQSLKDQNSTFVTKTEHSFICQDVRDLRENKARMEGKADQKSVMQVMIISIVSLFISIINFILRMLG